METSPSDQYPLERESPATVPVRWSSGTWPCCNRDGARTKKLPRAVTSWLLVSSPILRVNSQEPDRCLAALRRSHSEPQVGRFRSAIGQRAPARLRPLRLAKEAAEPTTES